MAGNRPISFEFLADVSQYLREVKGASITTEDLADALVGVSESGDDLERRLGRAMRDAAKDAEVLERAIRDIPKATDAAADQTKRDFDRMGDQAGEAGREIGDELRQNLGESLASGDLQDVASDTIGGLISSMSGAAGAAAGAIGGVGLLIFNGFRQEAEKMKAAVEATFSTMWGNIIEDTGEAFGAIQANINIPALVSKEFTRLWEDEPEGMRKLVEQAELLGIAAGDVVLARAGDEAAIGRIQTLLEDQFSTQEELRGMTQEERTARVAVNTAIEAGNTSLAQTKSTVDAYNRSVEDMPALWGTVDEAVQAVTDSMGGTISKADELKIKAADTNMDGLLNDTEVSKANIGEILTKAGMIPDPGMKETRADIEAAAKAALDFSNLVNGVPRNITVGIRFNTQEFGSLMAGQAQQYNPKYAGPGR